MLQVDVDAVDFGMVAFGFRYAKEFTLTNTCAIPMQYAWRVPKDSLDPAHKEFTVSMIRFSNKMTCAGRTSLYLILEAGVGHDLHCAASLCGVELCSCSPARSDQQGHACLRVVIFKLQMVLCR